MLFEPISNVILKIFDKINRKNDEKIKEIKERERIERIKNMSDEEFKKLHPVKK